MTRARCPGACTTASSVCSDAGNIAGKYPGGDPDDKYKLVSGAWTLQGTAGYTLDKRTQQHPNELAVGVRILYHFQASAPIKFFNVQTSKYAVMCLAPTEAGT